MENIFLKGKRILLAEDNPVNQMIVRLILEKKGSVVTIVENGNEAIEKVKLNQYDLILMDVEMPLMDGFEATNVIRKQLCLNTPIIGLSAHSLNQESEKFIESGLDGFISKPFTLESLCRSIENILVHQNRQV